MRLPFMTATTATGFAPQSPVRAALLCFTLAMLVLPACSWMPFRHSGKEGKANSCNKPQLYEQAQGAAPLRVPVGLDALNTRTALKIPDLREPEAPRKPSDACLDEPPKYSNAQLLPTGTDAKPKSRWFGRKAAAKPAAPPPVAAPAPPEK
jgi:hypothetical protein